MSVALTVDLGFRLVSGLHVTGERLELWTDKALVLDWQEERHPVIPATTIKGWLREGAERMLRSLGVEACDGSNADRICGRCLACEVFGSPQRRSSLWFEDAKLCDALQEVRMGVSLSRYRKTSYEERLFSLEVAWGSSWSVRIWGFFLTLDKAKQAAALLWVGARMGYAVGAARSRGLGWLHLKDFRVEVDGKQTEDAALFETLKVLVSSTRGGGS